MLLVKVVQPGAWPLYSQLKILIYDIRTQLLLVVSCDFAVCIHVHSQDALPHVANTSLSKHSWATVCMQHLALQDGETH